MSEKTSLFQKEWLGFNREEVIAYIEKVNNSASKLQQDLTLAREKAAIAEEKQKQLELKVTELTEANKAILVEKEKQDKEYTEKKSTDSDNLNKRYLYLEKLEKDAKKQAEELLLQANKKAEQILLQAREKSKIESEQITKDSKQQLEENLRKLKYLYRKKEELEMSFDSWQKEIKNFFESIKNDFKKD